MIAFWSEFFAIQTVQNRWVASLANPLLPTNYQPRQSTGDPEAVNLSAKTTVSRFFSDRHDGAASGDTNPPEGLPHKRQRSLLQRLHIHTSIKRGKSPTPIRPPSALATTSGGSTITATRGSLSQPDANIAEITRMMPKSLSIGTPPPQVASSVKRPRSAGSRDPRPRPPLAGQKGTKDSRYRLSTSQLRPNIKIPPYLEKSKTGKSYQGSKGTTD